jgi:hypothetical protein
LATQPGARNGPEPLTESALTPGDAQLLFLLRRAQDLGARFAVKPQRLFLGVLEGLLRRGLASAELRGRGTGSAAAGSTRCACPGEPAVCCSDATFAAASSARLWAAASSSRLRAAASSSSSVWLGGSVRALPALSTATQEDAVGQETEVSERPG